MSDLLIYCWHVIILTKYFNDISLEGIDINISNLFLGYCKPYKASNDEKEC